MVEALLGALAVAAGIVAYLWRTMGKAKGEARQSKEYISTRRRMDEAGDGIDNDPGALREFLRARGQSGGDL